MRVVTVEINGQEVQVAELKSVLNSEWRTKFEAIFGEVAEMIDSLPNAEIGTPSDLAALFAKLQPVLLGSIDHVVAMCVAYDPRFADAYDSECIAALPQLGSLAYPFGQLASMAKNLIGRATALISPS